MEKIIINNCPACTPVNIIIEDLLKKGFKISEQRIEDYHFHQLYFKLSGPVISTKEFNPKAFKKVENKFICECHWSTIELIES